ncbi:MAG: DNA-specific endonuclease I (Modular protein) [Candidatus Yanofskybacteria bacterium GW2011_GWD2_39_48]|uniref:DNA-specific endonuclease I (Modular protein) n=1 Tax=Candidatus Yanofskybacteria bacterium GW2011_GWD2_39_48 TaxID=1619031 RepID=A0A0G0PFK8_9BACT|nr:MAG: DNA-specific endonuclease I (Modular protein) [Candidatus Yanofskybacteria bacterium GW2011_GWD2_39_48]
MLTKIGGLVKRFQYDIYLGTCFALVAIVSFNLGRVGLFGSHSISYTQNANIYQAIDSGAVGTLATPTNKLDRRVVASKSSTSMKYHFTWCASGSKIKEENKVWFNTEAEAITAGYSLAGNCQ